MPKFKKGDRVVTTRIISVFNSTKNLPKGTKGTVSGEADKCFLFVIFDNNETWRVHTSDVQEEQE